MNKSEGKIVKGIGGFYYVKTPGGVVECRARGKFRKNDVMPYVGDDVSISVEEDGTGYVLEIMERKNKFIRPPIANVDKMLIVAALRDPEPDTLFIDKLLVTADFNNVEAAICFNKCDLTDDGVKYADIYTAAGYKVWVTSTREGIGIESVKEYMKGSVTAVCGFSGVGKSSLLNSVTGTDLFKVGDISEKLNRGKHTTRHVELYEYDENSFFADTPGFSMLSLGDDIKPDELINYFPDLSEYTDECRFGDCSHINNKFCGVCNAYSQGLVSGSRYENYCYLYNSLNENKEWKK